MFCARARERIQLVHRACFRSSHPLQLVLLRGLINAPMDVRPTCLLKLAMVLRHGSEFTPSYTPKKKRYIRHSPCTRMFVVFFIRSPTPTGNYPKSRLDHTWPWTEKWATPSTEERINCGAFITGFVSCSENGKQRQPHRWMSQTSHWQRTQSTKSACGMVPCPYHTKTGKTVLIHSVKSQETGHSWVYSNWRKTKESLGVMVMFSYLSGAQ